MTKKLLIFSFFFLLLSFKAQATTFPESEAGIASYAQIANPGPDKLAQAIIHADPYGVLQNQPSHIVISIEKETEITAINGDKIQQKIPVRLYLNTDGWMVAYLHKNEPSSRIMQWTGYVPGQLNTTILQDVLNDMSDKIQSSFATSLKYYHFQYPEADRMTIVVETIVNPNQKTNTFSVIIPGTVHETSASFYCIHGEEGFPSHCTTDYGVDDYLVRRFFHPNCMGKQIDSFLHGQDLRGNTPHLVSLVLNTESIGSHQCGTATVFIYQID